MLHTASHTLAGIYACHCKVKWLTQIRYISICIWYGFIFKLRKLSSVVWLKISAVSVRGLQRKLTQKDDKYLMLSCLPGGWCLSVTLNWCSLSLYLLLRDSNLFKGFFYRTGSWDYRGVGVFNASITGSKAGTQVVNNSVVWVCKLQDTSKSCSFRYRLE